MASAYDKASLVMLPNAYKDGKVYSVKPEDRSGDFTFTRPTAATRVGVNGLIEKDRENLVTYSNTFSSWTSINSTLTSNQAGYDGTNDAWLIEKTADAGRIQNNVVAGLATYSVYAKAGSASWLRLLKGANASAYFDLSNGTIGNLSLTIDATITSVGNGWYRCTITYKDQYAGSVRIYPALANNDTTGTSGNILIQDSQIEQGLVATDYIETGASTAQAGITDNVPRLDYTDSSCPALLLEPLRSNLITQSEYFETSEWTTPNVVFETNKAISPDGGLNATKFRANSANSTHWASTDVTLTSGQDYTFKLYLKSAEYDWVQISLFGTGWVGSSKKINFNASTGEFGTTDTGIVFDSNPMGNGWHEVFITNEAASTSAVIRVYPMPSDNATSYQGDGSSGLYIFGAQLEKGSYPTSYIPTYGNSVSRAADDALATHTIADTETLTFFTKFVAPERQSGGGEYLLNNSSGSSRIRIYQNTSDTLRIRTDLPAVNFNYSYSSLGISIGDKVKVCLRIENGVTTVFINGVDKNTFGAATINFAKMRLRPQTIMNVDSTIIFPTALSDAECIALTTI